MASVVRRIFTSPRAKKVFLVFILLFVLFFISNDFILPWYVNQGGIIEVPSVIGRDFEKAVEFLDSVGLDGRKGDIRADRQYPEGAVIMQNPIPGEQVKHGRRIYLTLSGGEQFVIVPNLRGRTIRDARFALEREGLKTGVIDYQPSDDFPPNTVIDQTPSAGTRVKKERYVSLTISQGPMTDKVTVADVSGKPLREATAILAGIGLKIGNVTYIPAEDLLPNTVIEQFPRAGELVDYGQAIDLFVVQGGEKRKEYFDY